MAKQATFDLQMIRSFGNIELLARQMVEGFITGLHKSPYHGFSVEFAEHRLYNTGESTRHIDWKVFAKSDRLFVKRYEEETNLRCLIMVDKSSSMYYPTENQGKITFSLMAAAALAHLLQKQRDAVGLCAFSDTIDVQTAIKSTGAHVHQLLGHLQHLMEAPGKDRGTCVADILHETAEKIHKRSLVILFTDMFEGEDPESIFQALQHMKHRRHEILVFHVVDKNTEYNFQFEDRPYEFVDLETGEKMKLQPSEVKDNFESHMAKYHENLKLRLGQLKIDMVEADINEGLESVLSSYLIKRARMR